MYSAIALSRPFVLVAFLATTAGCGGGDLLLPDPPGGGENVALSKVTGDNQSGVVGQQLPEPLVVEVLTERQLPAGGRKVAFIFTSAAGEVTPDTAITSEKGQASARWSLGTQPGLHTITARLADVADLEGDTQVAEFTAEARAAEPDTMRAQSAVSQPGRRGKDVGTAPVVRVVDRFGNPVPGVAVSWTVITGGGEVSEPTTDTATDGTATVTWHLGNRVGVQRLTASVGEVEGSPVTFTATVLF
jgi:hypothetical protein